jgi:hypothetical protein
MWRYRVGPLLVESNRPLPEVRVAREPARARADWSVRLRRPRKPAADHRWFHRWRLPDGRAWLRLAHDAGLYILRFDGLADFHVSPAQHLIEIHPAPAATPTTVRHLLLDQVLPLTFGTGRRLALHASAVQSPAGVIGFLGAAGSGKSTLAVELARRGWVLLGDDCLIIEAGRNALRARATYPGARLHADSLRAIEGVTATPGTSVAQYTRKRRIDPERAGLRVGAQGTPLKIARLYVLAPDARLSPDRPHILPLSPRAAMLELLRFTFHLDLRDRRAVASRFDLAAITARRVPACRLSFRHDFSGLKALSGCVEADVIG